MFVMCSPHSSQSVYMWLSGLLTPDVVQKPDQAGLQSLVGPVGAQMQAAGTLTEGKRTAAFNHIKVVAESLQALSWVVYSGPSCGACLSLPLCPKLLTTESALLE